MGLNVDLLRHRSQFCNKAFYSTWRCFDLYFLLFWHTHTSKYCTIVRFIFWISFILLELFISFIRNVLQPKYFISIILYFINSQRHFWISTTQNDHNLNTKKTYQRSDNVQTCWILWGVVLQGDITANMYPVNTIT